MQKYDNVSVGGAKRLLSQTLFVEEEKMDEIRRRKKILGFL